MRKCKDSKAINRSLQENKKCYDFTKWKNADHLCARLKNNDFGSQIIARLRHCGHTKIQFYYTQKTLTPPHEFSSCSCITISGFELFSVFFVELFVEKIKDVSLSNYTAKTFEKSIKIDVDERFMKMKSCMRHKRERLLIASRVKTIELKLIFVDRLRLIEVHLKPHLKLQLKKLKIQRSFDATKITRQQIYPIILLCRNYSSLFLF